MIAMRMMKPAVHEIIDVIAMRERFMAAVAAMCVLAADLGRAMNRMRGVYRNHMLVDMLFVHMVKVAVVEIIDMALVADRHMPAARAVPMGVVGMLLLGASCHDNPPFSRSRPAPSREHRSTRRSARVGMPYLGACRVVR
jgi:hypothetical protein